MEKRKHRQWAVHRIDIGFIRKCWYDGGRGGVSSGSEYFCKIKKKKKEKKKERKL
jgi:hypothetical protein